MRRLVDNGGVTLDQILERLTPEMLGGRPIPSRATLSKRFAGEGLGNNGALVKAVVALCAPPDEVDLIQEQVDDLLGRARARRLDAGSHRREAASENLPGGPAEIELLRAELAQERKLRHRSELTAAVLVGLFAGRISGGPGIEEPASTITEMPRPEKKETAAPADLAAPVSVSAVEVRPVERPSRDDKDLTEVVEWFRQHDPSGVLVSSAIRAAMDEVLDGPSTGRYSLSQLDKYERTYLGHHVQRAFRRAFGLAAGEHRDFSVQGVEFDLKFSLRRGGWLVSPDQVGAIVLFVYGSEEREVCGAGLYRVTEAALAGRPNRDRKSSLHRQTLDRDVIWLASETPLPVGILSRLAPAAVQSVFGKRTGSQRVEELVRQAQGEIVDANAFETAAMQKDSSRRVRDARRNLAAEGFLVLSGADPGDRRRAQEFGFRSLARDEYAVVRDHRPERPHQSPP